MMERFIYISCILTTLFAFANCARIHDVDPPMYAPSMSPSTPDSPDIPTSDCSDVIFAMADCVPFISEGSKATKPDGSCCPGLKMVLKAGDDCLCEAIESSTDLGISINMTLALSLPSACGISDNSAFRQCDLPLPPGASISEGPPPKPSPKKSQSPKAQRAPATSLVNIVPAPAVTVPAPVSAHSGTYSTSASLVLILSMVTASFYSVAF